MPGLNNIVTIRYISQMAGVQMSNSVDYEIDSLGASPTPATLLAEMAVAYIAAVEDLVVTDWNLVCLIYENQTIFEAKEILFVSLAGIAVGDTHPSSQVLRFNRWGIIEAGQEQSIISSFSQSGIAESFSTRDRLNDDTIATPMETFLEDQLALPTFGTITPSVFGLVIPTLPGPPVAADQVTGQCRVNPTFLKMRSRKASLCNT